MAEKTHLCGESLAGFCPLFREERDVISTHISQAEVSPTAEPISVDLGGDGKYLVGGTNYSRKSHLWPPNSCISSLHVQNTSSSRVALCLCVEPKVWIIECDPGSSSDPYWLLLVQRPVI